MRSIISAFVVMLVISAGAYGVLSSVQMTSAAKFSTQGVRL